MIIHSCILKKYALSAEEETTLKQAAIILDELYANSQENGKWEANFQKARDDLIFLLDELANDEALHYWLDEIDGGSITVQE